MAASKQDVQNQRMSAFTVATTIEENEIFTYRPSKTSQFNPHVRIQFLGQGETNSQAALLVRYIGQPFTCICHSTEAGDGLPITVKDGEILSITRLSNCLKWADGGSGRVNGGWEECWADSTGISFAEYRRLIE